MIDSFTGLMIGRLTWLLLSPAGDSDWFVDMRGVSVEKFGLNFLSTESICKSYINQRTFSFCFHGLIGTR